jgi:8-oxo-dGTP diphosphatase
MVRPPPVRLAVDAVVVQADQILLLEYLDDRFGRHFGLPGGGVEPGETLHDAVRREVREETGYEITVGPLLFVNELIPALHADLYGEDHQLRLLFRCAPVAGTTRGPVTLPDADQTGVRWVPLAALPALPFFPRMGERLIALLNAPTPFDPYNTNL